jgi:hypothetical protein
MGASRRGARRWVALASLLSLVASCARHPTQPGSTDETRRTVSALVMDSLGEPAANASVTWISRDDSAALTVTEGMTDGSGIAQQVLHNGGCIVTAGENGGAIALAAGASFVVAGVSRAAADTELVRLVLHTASRASGRVTLAGRTDHHGTTVVASTGGLAVTDSTGGWSIGDLPPGSWDFTAMQVGFAEGIGTLHVTQPGSIVTAPTLTLVSSP